jgi:hypothetical protein
MKRRADAKLRLRLIQFIAVAGILLVLLVPDRNAYCAKKTLGIWVNPLYQDAYSNSDNNDAHDSRARLKSLVVYPCQSVSDITRVVETQMMERNALFSISCPTSVFIDAADADILNSILEKNSTLSVNVFSYAFSASYSSTEAVVEFTVTYLITDQQYKLVDQKIDTILESIITPGMDLKTKTDAIHDWIVLNVAYDLTLTEHSDYAALFLGTTVCQGYSILLHKMLDKAGITGMILVGEAEGGSHSWNLVSLCGNWYHIDATWDDPVPDKPGFVRSDYLLISDAKIAETHVWNNANYPSAPDEFSEFDCQPTIVDSPLLYVSVNGISVALSWSKVADATGYLLRYTPIPYGSGSPIYDIDLGNLNAITVDLMKGAAFYVVIEAYNNASKSELSNIESVIIP